MLRYDLETREFGRTRFRDSFSEVIPVRNDISGEWCEFSDVKDLLKGLLSYIEDGNVVELRECGFIEELKDAIGE